MDRLLLALAIVAVAVVVALVARRRRVADAPTQTTHHVPDQLDPADFRPLVDPESAEALALCRRALAMQEELQGADSEAATRLRADCDAWSAGAGAR